MRLDPDRGVSRRDFVAAAVAIGGSSALSACLDREGSGEGGIAQSLSAPVGTDPASLPVGQHVWNEYMVHGPHGNTMLPNHQLVLGLSYTGSVPPTDEERAQIRGAIETLDRACQWGTGGQSSTTFNEGLLSLIGYSPRHFDRMGGTVDQLVPAEEMLEAVGEDPDLADGFDAILILNSDLGSVVLGAEEAVLGEREELNGERVEGTFEGVFEVAERRTGIVGPGNPARELDNENVPDDAPLSMGFRSGFADNQAGEDRVTIQSGPFAGGTTLQASRLHIDLERWYDQPTDTRIREMFSPTQDPDDIGPVADHLGRESEITEEDATVDAIERTGTERGMIGHTQKVANARDSNFEPKILRRTEGVATDVAEGAGFNFQSVQREVQDFIDVRKAMNPEEYDDDVPDERHGIIDYLETEARGVFLVPPRDQRALPTL